MKKKIFQAKRAVLNWCLKGCSLTTMMFVFQACYGPPQASNVRIQGKVVDYRTGEPIQGIKVSVEGDPEYETTSSTGDFQYHTRSRYDQLRIQFTDINKSADRHYAFKDTVVDYNPDINLQVRMKVEENEQGE